MTDNEIRDQFATLAMQMLINKHSAETVLEDEHNSMAMQIARGAYSYADAMMKVRNGEML